MTSAPPSPSSGTLSPVLLSAPAASDPAASGSAEPHVEGRHPAFAVAALCVGGLAVSLSQTMVVPIQGRLPELLGSTASATAWVVTVTLLAGAVAMPVAGRVADIVGKQRVVVACVVMLLVGCVVSALASSLAPMLVGRALQGAAMGLVPVGIALMRQITPPRMAGSAIATMSATLGVGGAIALPLSAWIVQVGSWHWLFWVSAALSLAVLLFVLVAVPHVHDPHAGARFDVPGAVGLSVGLVLLLVGISKGSSWGWSSTSTLGCLVGGVVVLAAWVALELRVAQPLVDIRTTARPVVLLTNVAAIAVGFGLMAQMVAIPQLLQLPTATGVGLGQTLLAAGLWMAPSGLTMMLCAPLSAAMIARFGPKPTLAIGSATIGIGYLVGRLLMAASWELLIATIVIAAGVGIAYAAMPTLVLDAVPPAEAGSAVGVNALARALGTTSASAVIATIITSDVDLTGAPTAEAFHASFLTGAVVALVGAAVALVIPVRRGRRRA
ncbi:MFS transporter [Nocardioides sp. GY 10127]|uniref:MFS transporter n=1 Tax=Nocardioides sp. GY 10127 TaxID=2569762 RepID=UPI0010A7A871|nr:MFS transporter [Nocardioides sp. GY 10127]TIC86450.1 MFS transporter [Nocardioides sp. GY 10127]